MSFARQFSCFGKYYTPQKKSNEPLDKEAVHLQKMSSNESYILTITRILRGLQFILTVAIFAITIFMISNHVFRPIFEVFPIAILTITTIYVFLTSLDIVSQFHGSMLPSSPMLFFSFLGVILFTIAGNLLITVYINSLTQLNWSVLTTLILCFILALLFLFDVMSFFASRKQKLPSRQYLLPPRNKCIYEPEILYLRKEFCPAEEKCKCDLATSISSLRQVHIVNDGNDHIYRKIGIGRRREYVDAQTSTLLMNTVDIGQIQTEPANTTSDSVQTTKFELKEKPIQTSNHCDVCQTPFTVAPQLPPQCGVCPSFFHLLQDKGQSCCNSCNCGSHQTVQEAQCEKITQSAQTKIPAGGHDGTIEDFCTRPTRRLHRVYETRPCPTHGAGLAAKLAGLPETVTKVAMFSYIQRHKKTQTPTKKIIHEEQSDILDEFHSNERTINESINEEPTINTNYSNLKESIELPSTSTFVVKRNKDSSENTQNDTDGINTESNIETDSNINTGTYRKKNKIRPVVRDTLYRT